MNIDKLSEGKKVFDIEIKALEETRDMLDDTFVSILDAITGCEGKVIVTGMGKPGHIAKKIAATLSSLGTSAFNIHPAEAMHGDLGMLSEKDILLVVSYSGESDEIIKILPNVKLIGTKIIALTGNMHSTLARAADLVQVLPPFEEACHLRLAPTSSTTAFLCYGDALAVVASQIYGFSDKDFGKLHPAGALGKKLLLKVEDLMVSEEDNATVNIQQPLMEAIIELSKKRLGIVSVLDNEKKLVGVITDGDLRRQLEKGADVYTLKVKETMTRKPITIHRKKMAIDALQLMKKKNINSMPVIEDGRLVGTICMRDIVGAGIVGEVSG